MKNVKALYERAMEAEEREDIDLCLELMNQAADEGLKEALEWLKDYYYDDSSLTQAWS